MKTTVDNGSLRRSAAELGLRRVVIDTAGGPMVARAGRRRSETATVLLHGAAGSWTTWIPLISASDRLGTPITDVVAFDLPGWGESVRSFDDIAEVSADIAEAVRSLGYERWRVVGHSLGGFVGLDLAWREPDATTEVGLVSASGRGVLDVARGTRAAVPGFAGMLGAMRLLARFERVSPSFLHGLHRAGLLRLFAAPLFAAPSRIDPTVIAALADEVRPAAFRDAAAMAAAYDETLWGGIRCPVTSVRGEHDVFAGRHDSEEFARLIPRFSESRLRAAGHFAHVERPEATLRELGLGQSAPSVRWAEFRRPVLA